MANHKISELNSLSSPSGSDILPIVNNGETKKITVDDLLSTTRSSITSSFATTGSNTFNGTEIISGSLNVNGSVNINNLIKLQPIDVLSTGSTLGDIAVSGSNLYFHTNSSWMKVVLAPVIDPTATPTPTPTVTPNPTSTPTATPAPTSTPTPTPTPHILIINNSSTRSVTSLQLSGSTIALDGGSYPVLNGIGYKMDGITVTAADGSSTLMLNFGGSGFFSRFRIYKNNVEVFNVDGYAATPMTMGGMTLSTSDYLRVELT